MRRLLLTHDVRDEAHSVPEVRHEVYCSHIIMR